MRTITILPSLQTELAANYFLEGFEEIIQRLALNDGFSITFIQGFYNNLRKYMEFVFGITEPDIKNIRKKRLISNLRFIADRIPFTHDTAFIDMMVKEISTDAKDIVTDLPELSDRHLFISQLDNIYDKNYRQLGLLTSPAIITEPSATDVIDVMLPVTDSIAFEQSTDPVIAQLELQHLNLIAKAMRYSLLSDKASLLKSIVMYRAAVQSILILGQHSTNFELFFSLTRFNLTGAIQFYSNHIFADNSEEALICNRKILAELQLLQALTNTTTKVVALAKSEMDKALRYLAATVMNFSLSKEFTFPTARRLLKEMIAANDLLTTRVPGDVQDLILYRYILSVKFIDHAIFLSQAKNYEMSRFYLLEAHAENLAIQKLGADNYQNQIAYLLKFIAGVALLSQNITLKRELDLLHLYQRELNKIPAANFTLELADALQLTNLNIDNLLYRSGIKYFSKNTIKGYNKAKEDFKLAVTGLRAINMKLGLANIDACIRISQLYIAKCILQLIILQDNLDSDVCSDDLFEAIDIATQSLASRPAEDIVYDEHFKDFIYVLIDIAERIQDDTFYHNLKVLQHAIFLVYDFAGDHADKSTDMLKILHAKFIAMVYEFVFIIPDSYERAMSENLNLMIDAVEEFNDIAMADLSPLNLFQMKCVLAELVNMKMICNDMMHESFKDNKPTTLANLSLFKTVGQQQMLRFAESASLMKEPCASNVLKTLKNTLKLWMNKFPNPNDSTEEVLAEVKLCYRIDSVMDTGKQHARRYSI